MRVAVEAGSWTNPRGYGRFLRGLFGALHARGNHRWVLALDEATARGAAVPDGVPVHTLRTGRRAAAEAAAAASQRTIPEMARAAWGLHRGRFDAVLFPSPHTYVPVPGTPELVVVHDVIAERFPDLVFEDPGAAARWRRKTSMALERARVVLTVSEHSRRGLVEHYDLDPQDVLVTGEAPGEAFLRPASPVRRDRPFALYVGGLSPHKNLGVLLDALERPGLADLDLVLAGPYGSDRFHTRDPAELLAHPGLAGRVHVEADLGDDALRDLYAGALALVLPSLDEGFGLPAVEAAAAGTALVLSRTTAAAELLDGAALTFAPDDPAALAAHLAHLRDEPAERAARIERGDRLARAMTWDAAALVVERALALATAGHRGPP